MTETHYPSQSLVDKLLNSASGMAAAIASPMRKKLADEKAAVTPKLGKRHRPYRRIINYERAGPFHRQVGTKWLSGECWPVMQTYYVHKFLHATKGRRAYTGGPVMRLPYAPPALPPQLAFYGRHA